MYDNQPPWFVEPNPLICSTLTGANQPIRLLIVEDVRQDAELIILTLEREGILFDADVVDCIESCDDYLTTHQYDAVLSDYQLINGTAYQVLELVQKVHPDIPVILVTGILGDEAAVDCIKAGITNYVLKDNLVRLPMVLAQSLQETELRHQRHIALEKLQEQAFQEQLLNQISRTLNSRLEPNYVLSSIVRLIGESINVDCVFIFSIEAETSQVIQLWATDTVDNHLMGLTAPASDWHRLVSPEFCVSADASFYCLALDNLQVQSSAVLEALRHTHIQSMLCVPIFIRDQFFGGLCLNTVHRHWTFESSKVQLLQRIADQTAIALQNAQRYEELEHRVQLRTQELLRQKQLAEAANEAKSQFLATMSHELRTPLTSILGFSSVLLQDVLGPLQPKQLQYLDAIHTSGKDLLALINDLLDLSKIEAGREELNIDVFSIADLCDACITQIRKQAEAKGLILQLAIAPQSQVIRADIRRVRQILLNLLSNAVKFTNTGGIGIRVDHTDEAIVLSVQDTGIGISKADQTKLFQPFCQLDSQLDRRYSGTGLGLALSQKLAQLHGGYITVSSRLKHGSCFTVYLPQPIANERESLDSSKLGMSRDSDVMHSDVMHSDAMHSDVMHSDVMQRRTVDGELD